MPLTFKAMKLNTFQKDLKLKRFDRSAYKLRASLDCHQTMLKLLLLVIIAANIHDCFSQSITVSQLAAIMPKCKHPEYLAHINAALVEGSINTCQRKAAFLAQLAHESGELVYMEELASGAAYEGRLDLGNTQPGDGRRYKGRGPIQLTGRANYRAAGKALGLDLEGKPELVKTPEVGFRTSVWFWTVNQLNDLADIGTLDAFRKITRKINGGTNGQADREYYWGQAKSALGCGGNTGSGGKHDQTIFLSVDASFGLSL